MGFIGSTCTAPPGRMPPVNISTPGPGPGRYQSHGEVAGALCEFASASLSVGDCDGGSKSNLG